MYTLRIKLSDGIYHNVNLGQSYTKIDLVEFLNSIKSGEESNKLEEELKMFWRSSDDASPVPTTVIYDEDRHPVFVDEIVEDLEKKPFKRTVHCYIINDKGSTVDSFSVKGIHPEEE